MKVTVDDLVENKEMRINFDGVRVLVDCVQHDKVIIADQESGYIEKYKIEDGKPVLNKKGDDILREKIFGKVEFIFKELKNDH